MDNLVQEINELGSVSKELILKETIRLSEESKTALLLKTMISNNNFSNPSKKSLQKGLNNHSTIFQDYINV